MTPRFWHLAGALFALAVPAFALEGTVQIHDPSTIVICDGKYYTYGTGGSSLVSDDGFTWHRGEPLPRRGLAPDVIHLGDRYFVYVAANIGAQPKAAVNLISTKSLDPKSPDYGWDERGVVASSNGIEDCNAIDPGVLLDPNDGRLWLTYGSYFGYIRLVELDPRTGMRVDPNSRPVDLAVNCEASIMIYHDGWYYLLVTHGSCCRGADSGYNIRMGRAKSPMGPFLDHEGIGMLEGGGKLFVGSSSRRVGPGHFGLLELGNRVGKFSCHYEADLDRGGASVLDVRPLLWTDGWPVAGENLREGEYQIESLRTGTVLELAVEGVPVGGPRPMRGPGPGGGGRPPNPTAGPPPGPAGSPPPPVPAGPPSPGAMFAGTGSPIPPQDVTKVSTRWPAGAIAPRLGNFQDQAQQKWTVKAVGGTPGSAGSPTYKITIAGTDRALATTDDGELTTVPAFSGGPEQLWTIEQMTDGAYRIAPKHQRGDGPPLALSALGASFATLSKLDPASLKQRWALRSL